MNISNLYLEYGSIDFFPAKYRIAAGALNTHHEKINSMWQKYFNAKDLKEQISILENIIIVEYEQRNRKVRTPMEFREFGRAYIKRAKLEEQDVLDVLEDKYGS